MKIGGISDAKMATTCRDCRDNDCVPRTERFGDNFQRIYHICCRTICLALVVINSAILDYYLIEYRQKSTGFAHYRWIVADSVVVCLFLVAFILSYKYYENRELSCTPAGHKRITGDLPFSYISWLFFSIVMSVKVCVIYGLPNSIANELDKKHFFGPNTLMTGLSLSAIILYLLVLSHHDFRTKSKQYEFIQYMVGGAYLDLLDTTQFLSIFGEEAHIITNYNFDKIILVIVCFNYVLPTEALYFLARSRFGICPKSSKFQLIHKVCCFLIVNVPMFIVRMIIWNKHRMNISVFFVKNIIAIVLSIKEFHEFCIDVSDVVVHYVEAAHRQKQEDPGHELDTIRRQGSVNCLDPDS